MSDDGMDFSLTSRNGHGTGSEAGSLWRGAALGSTMGHPLVSTVINREPIPHYAQRD
jgi:hypothetical protein